MSKNQEYAERYAEYAMEQMRRYGIPASVTLAQGIMESSNGQSELSRLGNNHFGIKATSGWLNNGGQYLVYTDDRPNEKFCKYASVGDSYEHHSQFLKNNSRYARCFSLSPDDYKGWTHGIANAGYATGGGYARNLQSVIERNDLQKYDQQVMAEMRAQGKSFGVSGNPRAGATSTAATTIAPTAATQNQYSFPVKRSEFLFITSPFGMRQDPMDGGKQQMYKGIDIRCKGDDVLATENGGKVVAVNQNANTGGGKSVTVEYSREDGGRVQCTYMHLSAITAKVGDSVNAGDKLGVSGNTGTRTTGEHLHFGVANISADGSKRDIDPAAYLAEIAQKGNINLQALNNGNDLLAKYKGENSQPKENLSPDDWMKKLLSSEDSGVGMTGGDPIVSMAMTMFSSLMMLAVQIDNKSEQEQKAQISDMANARRIDMTSLVQGTKSCTLSVGENGKAVLQADNGNTQVSRELTASEMNKLSMTLSNDSLTDEAKRMRVAGLVNNILLSQQVSQNYEQGMANAQGQNENIKR